MLCSTDVDANPPNGSERIDPVEDVLVMGVTNVSTTAAVLTLVGVVARLTPLLLVPLDCGVLNAERPGLSDISRGGDLDFFRDADEPATPITFDVVKLVANEFITASAMR